MFLRPLCPECLGVGYCRLEQSPVVDESELSNPDFIRDVRQTAFDQQVPASRWLDHLYDLYCSYAGQVVDHRAEEVFLDLDHHFNDDEEDARRRIINWFSEVCCTPCPDHVKPRVRREARERFRILATLLRATYPERALLWGVRPANDNRATARR